jgi:peroxiredoxin
MAQAQKEPAPRMPNIKVGDLAPDFTLVDQNGQPHLLHDYRGKSNVVLAFYLWAFSPTWTQEVRNFQQNLAKLEAADTQVLGVSMDNPYVNKAFADQNGVTFPLLSDFGGTVTKEYGIYQEYDKFHTKIAAARRTTYLIDKNGKVMEMQVDADAVDPTKTVTACERRKLKG